MARLIDPYLKKLSALMSSMGEMSIRCISLAIDSYLKNKNYTKYVYELSNQIKDKYFEVEDLTFDILLRYQPVADDFRFIRSSTEISYAFSRFGRYAYDITLVRDLFGNINECKNSTLDKISYKVKQIIKDAMSSFSTLDIKKALVIRENERFIDQIYRERLPMLIKSNNTKCALVEALILRYLERIGDHAVFMSDAVNYIVTGKHRPTPNQISLHVENNL